METCALEENSGYGLFLAINQMIQTKSIDN